MKSITPLLAILLWLPASPSSAHLRDYLVNYGYYTLEKGRAEVELKTDHRLPESGNSDTGFFVNQTEVSYGITDRYTLGLYGIFVDGLGFTAFKAENRYRLGNPGEWPVDVALYLEGKLANGRKDENEIETKIILSKDFGKLNVVANPILGFEEEVAPNGKTEWEVETGLTLGAAYSMGKFTPGLEFLFAENKSQVIPGVYIDIWTDLRLNIGAAFGLEKKADDFQLKTILELEF